MKALRRWIPRAGTGTEVVDLAVVCQLLEEPTDREPIELVRLSWQIKDREALLRALSSDPAVVGSASRHFDVDDEESPEVPAYQLLDRHKLDARSGLKRDEIPLILGEIVVGPETVAIETSDDGRLNGLIDRFTALAGKAIPPAHPRTKVIGRTSRSELAMSWHWYLPPGLPNPERQRLNQEQIAHIMTTVWPDTPMDYLGGKTPRQAARSGQFQVPLRAAVLQMQLSEDEWGEKIDWAAFRAGLGIEPEPAIDPLRVDIDEVPLARLGLIPVERARRRTPGQALSPGPRVGAWRAGREGGPPDRRSRRARRADDHPGDLAVRRPRGRRLRQGRPRGGTRVDPSRPGRRRCRPRGPPRPRTGT